MRSRAWIVAAVSPLLLAGCSEYQGASEEVGEPEPVEEVSEQETEGIPAMDSTMNDPDATPADQLTGADLVSGEFELLDTAPTGYDEVGGLAYLGQEADGTTVTVRLTGLEPETEYLSHLHEQSCPQDAGGDHFAFDPDGEAAPPNEVHLAFTTGEDGSGEATVTNDRRVEDNAPSVVVHESGGTGERIACADLDTDG